MEKFDTEFIASSLNEKTIQEVSLVLQDMYPNKCGFSIRSLRPYCAKHRISKRILLNMLENLVAEVSEVLNFRSRLNNVYMVYLFPHWYF